MQNNAEVYFMSADTPLSEWKVISPLTEGHEYSTSVAEEIYTISHDQQRDAENFTLFRGAMSRRKFRKISMQLRPACIRNLQFFKINTIINPGIVIEHHTYHTNRIYSGAAIVKIGERFTGSCTNPARYDAPRHFR